MSLEDIAVVGLTISHGSGSTITGGSFTVTSLPSTKVKAGGAFVYRGTIDFTFSGGSEPTVTSGSVVGSGSISFTATKVKADGQFVIRKGDTGTLTGTGTNPSPPPPTLPVSGPVEITNAGQSKVKAQ